VKDLFEEIGAIGRSTAVAILAVDSTPLAMVTNRPGANITLSNHVRGLASAHQEFTEVLQLAKLLLP
jgi:hypothetical protein